MKFRELAVGDMFNTKPARFVKINETEAIVVMSSVWPVGEIISHENDDHDLVVLYSAKQRQPNQFIQEIGTVSLLRDLKYPEDYVARGFRVPQPGEDEEDENNHEHFVCKACDTKIFLHFHEIIDEYVLQKEAGLCIECDQM